MSYSVALLNFEGPLDLLLQLIERSELSITEISLAGVTEQYLAYIEELHDLDPLELNQFVELAAKLAYIKSLALLPRTDETIADEEISELAEQLEQYRHYQKATNYLNDLLRAPQRSWSRTKRESLPVEQIPDPELNIDTLSQTFADALARLPMIDSDNLQASFTIEEMMERVLSFSKQTVPASLSKLLSSCHSRTEAVVLFLALLELLKGGVLAVDQHKQFGDIIITNV